MSPSPIFPSPVSPSRPRGALEARLPIAIAIALVAPPALGDPLSSPAPRASIAPQPPAVPAPDDTRALRFTGGIALGGVGLVAVLVGSVLGVRALVDKNDVGKHCNLAFQCDLTGYTLGSEARDFALISTASFAFGLVATAAGVALVVSGAPMKPGAAAWITPAAGGLRAGARW